jgi:type IV secretory pathway TrbL component
MRDAGILVCESPSTLGAAMKELLAGRKSKASAPARVEAKAAPRAAGKPAAKAARVARPARKGAAGKKTSKR